MSTTEFLTRCREISASGNCGQDPNACSSTPELSEADSLIGIFQHFRPDGEQMPQMFESLDVGDSLVDRMERVYEVAGDNRRPQGGLDAYFVVRSPQKLTVEATEHHGEMWLKGIAEIAASIGDQATQQTLANLPSIRVLEGIPPKHPKKHEERCDLLRVLLERCREMTSEIENVDPHAALLRPAYYFIACDHMLRDYLMWPFFASQTGLADPLKSYFWLWSHGVKYRTFQDGQLDLYLPRGLAD